MTGQDGDKAALNRVALGTQLVSVWKDSRVLGKMAGEAAVALADGTAMDALPGVAKFKGGKKGVEMNSILHRAEPDHQGQSRRRDRRGLDHQGRGLRRRGGGLGCCLQLIRCQTI